MNLAAAAFALGCLGAGGWSLDEGFDTQFSDWWGLIAVLVIGVGGTLALLAAFWRPPAPAKPAEAA
jgi:hypothetical protein